MCEVKVGQINMWLLIVIMINSMPFVL